jgi:hypothetical protein
MILVNNNDFSNSKAIPINEYPALISNRLNLKTWGWSYLVSQAVLPSPYTIVNRNPTHPIMKGINMTNIPVYSTFNKRIFYLDDDYVYQGMTLVASTQWDPNDAVIAVVPAGTTLTSQEGKPPTLVKANSVFFGVYESGYWTDDAKKLFKNSLRWILDNDGDGYIGTQDCDDNDPLIPGPVEIIYNGKDDDCNLATPDYPAPTFIDIKTEPRTPTRGTDIVMKSTLGGKAIHDVILTYNVNGGQNVTNEMNFDSDVNDTASLWKYNIGNFNASDVITYSIYANNVYGPESTSQTYSFTVMRELVNFNLQLEEGYNLISLPLQTGLTEKDEIFSNVGVAKTLSNGQLVNTTTLSTNKGYFVYSDSRHIETILGAVPVEQQSISIGSGMNLVGITSTTSKSLDSLPQEVVEVSKRNLDGSYTIATYYPGHGWNNAFSLEPGKGYWMKASAATTWQYMP